MFKNQANHAGDNYAQPHSVLTNGDLLTEILIRLPILCMHLFTSISKNDDRIPNIPHFHHSRIQSRKGTMENSFTLATTEAVENVKIMQCCNGLLLCTGSGWRACYYVFNPSTNLFKRLPPPDYSHADSPFYLSVGLIMAFNPTKSCNYKVVHVGQTSSHIDIQTYCSETRNWSLCSNMFPFFSFLHFNSATYLNGALHWLKLEDIMDGLMHFKLNIEDHPILTSIKIYQGLHRVRYFFEPLGNNLPMCITIRLEQRFYLEGKLFESRGYLLAVLRHYFSSREFTIYEMRKGCSVWSVRYLVNTDDFMNPLPEGWSIWSTVWSIVLGEREDDSCLVINLSGKAV
ncbi:hypothetical protein Tco_0995904 [Tanacetum coccineum]